jgi:hypothetical protein
MAHEDDGDLAGTNSPGNAKRVRELTPITFDRPGHPSQKDFRPRPTAVPTTPPAMILPEEGMTIEEAPATMVHPSALPPS